MPTDWRRGLLMGHGWATFSGVVGDNHEHAHHALQLVVANCGDIGVWAKGHGEIHAPAVLLGADVTHRLSPGDVRLWFLDRESLSGRALTVTCTAGVRLLTDSERAAALKAWPMTNRSAIEPLLVALGLPEGPSTPDDATHDRVREVLEALPDRGDRPVDLVTLAREAALSPSRFRHRAKALLGMPLRPYLRWLRLRHALAIAASGFRLTYAAQEAGFADSAHLTRTMRRHFGVAPSEIFGALKLETPRDPIGLAASRN